MPQVFGSSQVDLMAQSSLWVDSASLSGDPRSSDLFGQFIAQEGFNRENPFNPQQKAIANGRLSYVKSLGAKTVGGAAPKRDSNGQLLNGDGYHEFVVHLDQRVPEGTRETAVGGSRRYELSYHHVDRNGKLKPMTAWSGNTAHGLNNAYEGLKTAMSRVLK